MLKSLPAFSAHLASYKAAQAALSLPLSRFGFKAHAPSPSPSLSLFLRTHIRYAMRSLSWIKRTHTHARVPCCFVQVANFARAGCADVLGEEAGEGNALVRKNCDNKKVCTEDLAPTSSMARDECVRVPGCARMQVIVCVCVEKRKWEGWMRKWERREEAKTCLRETSFAPGDIVFDWVFAFSRRLRSNILNNFLVRFLILLRVSNNIIWKFYLKNEKI